ncbi:MAG: hypothetical protein LAO77_10950 [Acidobacteriia bacterium]|nr:hypothetical protein [Terriglobia bacterium]
MPGVPAGAIAERRLIQRLLKADAVRSDSAQPLENLRWVQQRRLERLIGLGVIREASAGRYYLYPPALADRMAARRVRVVMALLAVITALALMTGLATFRTWW